MTVFASSLQAHAIGVSVYTEQYRGGTFEGYLGRNAKYEYISNYVALQAVDGVIEPKDIIVHYCIYNSDNRTSPTLPGPSLMEEVCTNYLLYYPAVDWNTTSSCITSFD